MSGPQTLDIDSRGISAPADGIDPAEVPNAPAAKCANCGHAGHEHDKERVYPDDGPAGSYHYRYVCPEGSA